MSKTHGKTAASRGLDASVGTASDLAPTLLNDAPARMGKTRVDSEDDHIPPFKIAEQLFYYSIANRRSSRDWRG